MNSFGIKEAKAARVFAKTPEQRQTVLAVVNMFGITNVVATQIKKGVVNLGSAINKKLDKSYVLRDKLTKAQRGVSRYEEELEDLGDISVDWTNQKGENSA